LGFYFSYLGLWGFFPLFQAFFTISQELMMLQKERSSGIYRLFSYFMSRVVVDLPMELVLPTIFLFTIYWMKGLKASVVNLMYTLLSLLLNVLAAQGLGFCNGSKSCNHTCLSDHAMLFAGWWILCSACSKVYSKD